MTKLFFCSAPKCLKRGITATSDDKNISHDAPFTYFNHCYRSLIAISFCQDKYVYTYIKQRENNVSSVAAAVSSTMLLSSVTLHSATVAQHRSVSVVSDDTAAVPSSILLIRHCLPFPLIQIKLSFAPEPCTVTYTYTPVCHSLTS